MKKANLKCFHTMTPNLLLMILLLPMTASFFSRLAYSHLQTKASIQNTGPDVNVNTHLTISASLYEIVSR